MFIVFEGIDGAGKSTQVALLAERLRRVRPDTLVVQEPGGTALGDRLRDLVKYGTDLDITPRAELLLFAASRAQLVDRVLRPALAQGTPVICDRYGYSTVAYQGYGRGLRAAAAEAVNIATAGLFPDLVIWLDLDVGVALQRKHAPVALDADRDRFEGEALSFYQRVRQGYREQAAADPDRWLTLDATLPPAELARIIWERAEKLRLQG